MKRSLPELCWGSMWLSEGRQGVHKAGGSQWARRAWPKQKHHGQEKRDHRKMGGKGKQGNRKG